MPLVELMNNQQIEYLIARALVTAKIDFPDAGNGTTWPANAMDPFEARHLAYVVMITLAKAGLSVKPSN